MSRRVLEACLTRVPNKFELVLLASYRAHKIAAKGGVSMSTFSAGGRRDALRYQKAPLLALREIASGVNDLEDLREECCKSLGEKPVTRGAERPVSKRPESSEGSSGA